MKIIYTEKGLEQIGKLVQEQQGSPINKRVLSARPLQLKANPQLPFHSGNMETHLKKIKVQKLARYYKSQTQRINDLIKRNQVNRFQSVDYEAFRIKLRTVDEMVKRRIETFEYNRGLIKARSHKNLTQKYQKIWTQHKVPHLSEKRSFKIQYQNKQKLT